MSSRTRYHDNNFIGSDTEMSASKLPTNVDVMRHYNFEWHVQKNENNGKNPCFSAVADTTLEKVESIWLKSSIPVISRRTMKDMLRKNIYEMQSLNKSFQRDKYKDNFKKRLCDFLERNSKLFDISACKCSEFVYCTCVLAKKVPKLEREFLIDQRTTRNMMIGNVDTKTTLQIKKRLNRKQKENLRKKTKLLRENDNSVEIERSLDTDSNVNDQDDVLRVRDSTYQLRSPSTTIVQTRLNINAFARTCDRYGIPDRPAAALASALITDLNISYSDQDELEHPANISPAYIIDKNKVRRQRAKVREHVFKEHFNAGKTLQALYFDGRIDETLYIHKSEEGKRYRKKQQEHHVSLVQEPGSKYIGHICPLSGKAIDIANAIMEYMTKNSISLNELICVGCDGYPTNTGVNNGAIRLLEKRLCRPLQWVIWQLHTNELPLRHLFEFLDGETSGPQGYKGPIGKSLPDCHNLPVVNFEPIQSNVEEIIPDIQKDLSTDQNYLYDICKVVSTGECPTGFEDKNPGKLSHARWITTANRILRLYIASNSPSDTLQELSKFVVKVYAPGWFTIKRNFKIKDGAVNLWKIINFSSYMKDEYKKVIYTCLQQNGYFAHSENLLLSMITDSRKHIRELAIRRIISARKKKSATAANIRKFKIPQIEFRANDYIDLIMWHSVNVTEPPLTMHLSEEDLNRILEDDVCDIHLEHLLVGLPAHTQAVERAVKDVTISSKQVCGEIQRDKIIQTRLLDRKIRPKFESKKQFKA